MMSTQVIHRLTPEVVRNVLGHLCAGELSCADACAELGVGKSRLYQLRAESLRARAGGLSGSWAPGLSGGNHMAAWPDEVVSFLRRAIREGYSYAFAASEAHRLHGASLCRSQVRRWAVAEGLRAAEYRPRPPAHVRRWQRGCVGELWQLDATTDYWFGHMARPTPLLDMVDDCSRLQVGCAMYARECLGSYVDFLRGAFMSHGLPLEIYVDQASFFRPASPGGATRLARRLRFYDVALVLANSPEAKGKVERIHEVWQDRLPPYFRLNGISELSDLEVVNAHIDRLRAERNNCEPHREVGMTPRRAWETAVAEGRSRIRPFRPDPWWEYVWSVWDRVVVGPRGRVRVGTETFPTECANGTPAFLCSHVDGTRSILLEEPRRGALPIVLFTNRKGASH